MKPSMNNFAFEHLPAPLRDVSEQCHNLATSMEEGLPENTEKAVGMRKLLEAKDCFVRAVLTK
jgi:hypothetical protein